MQQTGSNETALGSALQRVGFAKHQMRAYGAAQEFIAAGGSEDEWIAVYRSVAKKLSGDGHRARAANGHFPSATAGQSNEGAAGQGERAFDSHHAVARSPSAEQISAVAQVKQAAALSVFDRVLTSTGRRWGDVTYRELQSMMDDGDLAREVRQHIGSLRGDDRHKRIRELMTPREFNGVCRKAGRMPNAA